MEQNCLSVGGSVKLLEESIYLEALGFQLTNKQFLALCSQIGVQMFRIGDKRYVDMLMFEIGLYGVLRYPGLSVGSFIAGEKFDRSVYLDWFESNRDKLVLELINARTFHNADTGARIARLYRDASTRVRRTLSSSRRKAPARD